MPDNLEQIVSTQQEEIDSLQYSLAESLGKIDLLLDRNWVPLFGGLGDQAEGPSLSQLHDASRRNQEQAAVNVHVRNGLRARTSYIWKGGIHYAGIPGKSQGRGVNVQERIDNPINQRYFFSQQAREEREAALYTDSQVFYYGDEVDYTIRPIPIYEITADQRNPNQADEVWAYRRAWTDYSSPSNPQPRVEWIYTNTFWSKRPRSGQIEYNGRSESVSRTKRIFGLPVNSFNGWAYGVPDVLCAISWAQSYRQAMFNGERITESMASIWAQAKANSSTGAADMAVRMNGLNKPGGVSIMGPNQELSVLPSAGSTYKFSDLLPLLACFAAGLGVSVIDISANPGNAGGGYASARSLEPMTIAMTQSRRAYHVDLDREVLTWLGAKPDQLEVWFDPISDPTEAYRTDQRIGLRLGTGLFKGEEIKQMFADADGKIHISPVPEGWLIPNNRESTELRTIDPNTSGSQSGNPANGGDFTPTQGSGQRFGSGGQGDQRSDDIRSNREGMSPLQYSLQQMRLVELEDKLDRVLNILGNNLS